MRALSFLRRHIELVLIVPAINPSTLGVSMLTDFSPRRRSQSKTRGAE